MSRVRYFNSAYIGDHDIGPWLDLLIYLANPNEKDASHITFQGPYFIESEAREALPRGLTGALIKVLGLGNFFDEGQNTVFLLCDSSAIAKYWYKPSGYVTQHLTLYDGHSRRFADELMRIYDRVDWSFTLAVGKVATIQSIKGEPRDGLLKAIDKRLLSQVVACRPDHSAIVALNERSRLAAIERVCNRVVELTASRGPRIRAAIA